MAHGAVEVWRLEAGGGSIAARAERLPQPEELGVVDEKRRAHGDEPADQRNADEHETEGVVRHVPEHEADRPPLGEEESQASARNENVSASLELRRHDAHPAFLEAFASHHAVLQTEKRDEQR